MLMILDGFGENSNKDGNAVELANTPNIDRLMKIWPTTDIHASELSVGLPEGQMGNSEVGHTNIGAGRIVYQELTKITKSIEDGDFFSIENCKKNNSKLHILGLVSDGGVHSHIRHLFAILELAKRKDFENVYVHCFTDGRDTAPTSGESYIAQLEEKMKEKGVGKIATISGRFYAMDRDKRWDREKLAYDAMVNGIGNKFKTVQKAVENSYEAQEFDEFVKPIVITDEEGNEIAKIKDKDSVIFFNFRPDRARQIVRVITEPDFSEFETVKMNNLYFVTMTEYDETLSHVHVAYKPQALKNTLGEVLSNRGYTQVRCAETEKYAHVTFFFNGGEEKQYKGEDRILVASPKVATYDLKPEMSAYEVTDKIIDAIESKKYDVIIMNYANGDMVGHTGIIEKAIEAVEALDTCVGKVISKLEEVGGEALITADHGNCEYMLDLKTGEAITSHSTFDVPLIVVSDRVKSLKNGRLCDLAPTLLALMGEEKPSEMTGESLVEL